MSQRQVEDFEIKQAERVPKLRIVDPKGREIKLTDRQKNEIYRKARELKEKVKEGLCSKNEAWSPTDANVRKMGNELKQSPKVEAFRKHMQAIGADPKDYSTERMRR